MTHRAPATTPATEDGKPVAGKRGIRVAAIGNGRGAPSWNEADNTFEFTLATETPCRAYRWNPRNDRVYEVDEVLLMSGIRNVAGLVGKPMELGDGSTRLSLQKPQMIEVIMAGGGMRKAALVGNERGQAATALVPAGVPWVAGEEFEGGRQMWTVALVAAWEPGWQRLTLAAS